MMCRKVSVFSSKVTMFVFSYRNLRIAQGQAVINAGHGNEWRKRKHDNVKIKKAFRSKEEGAKIQKAVVSCGPARAVKL